MYENTYIKGSEMLRNNDDVSCVQCCSKGGGEVGRLPWEPK